MTEGFVQLDIPDAGKPCQTWYKIFGSIGSSQLPLICVHGGPGACHEYLLSLEDIATIHGKPIVLYDQLGNGKSTRLPEKAGDEGFWTENLFLKELDALLAHLGLHDGRYDLLGQSWGGMLAARFAAQRPKGPRKLVLASSPASIEEMQRTIKPLREALPMETRETLDKYEAAEDWTSGPYEEACMVFYKRHVCRLEEWPPEFLATLGHLSDDTTTYGTM